MASSKAAAAPTATGIPACSRHLARRAARGFDA